MGVTTTSYALGDIPAFHDGAGACCGKAGPIGGTSGGTCMGVQWEIGGEGVTGSYEGVKGSVHDVKKTLRWWDHEARIPQNRYFRCYKFWYM